MEKNPLNSKKQPVLVRLPIDLYEALLTRSAAETLIRRTSISVPKIIVEILAKAIEKNN